MGLPKESVSWFSSYILVYNVANMNTFKIPIVLSPSNVSESISATYDSQTAPGRSAPVISYSSTGARTLSFSMRVSMDMLPKGYGKNIDLYINSLKSLLYPDYSVSGGVIRPPHCKVVIGSISIDGVCTSFSATYNNVFAKRGQFMVADVDLGFTEVLKKAPGNVYFITGEKEKDTDYDVKATFEQSPTLTLFQNGAVYKSSTGEMCNYKLNSNVMGEASYYPADMCSLGYTLYRASGKYESKWLTSGMVYDLSEIFTLLNSEPISDSNTYYRLFYHLLYDGNEVDSQRKFRYIKIVS